MTFKSAARYLALYLFPLTTCRAQTPLTVTFLHMNDHHSHFDSNSFDMLPEAVPGGLSLDASEGVKVYYGGAAYIAGAIKHLAGSGGQPGNEVMKIHAGDAVTGTVYYSLFGAEPDAIFLNTVGFEVFVPGNHEFDDGDGNLATFLNMLNHPVTSYNLKPGPDSPLNGVANLVDKFVKTVENSGGEKVGFCGMTPKKKTEESSFPDPGTTIQEEVGATTACVADLKAEGVNKIVVVSHAGYKADTEKLAMIEGVDVIIGGDSHTLLGVDASGLGGPSSSLDYATIVNGVCVVQAWEYQKVVGEIAVKWDANGNVLECSGTAHLPYIADKFTVIDKAQGNFDMTNPLDIDIMKNFLSSQPNFLPAVKDMAVADALQPYYEKADEQMQTEIAVSNHNMCHNRGQGGDVPVKCNEHAVQTKLGGGVCQLVSQGFLFKVPDADFAIQNAGGCRTDIDKGSFSIADAYSILPFSNTLVTLALTGEQIKQVLEDALENFLNETIAGSSGSFPNAAGLRWEADYTELFGHRIINLEMNSRLESDQWKPIVMDTRYLVVTNNFIAQGKDGYLTFTKAGEYTDTFVNYAQSFMDFAKSVGTLETPAIESFSSQKITFENGEVADSADVSPATPAPVTSSPATPAPVTSSPATSAPSAKSGKQVKGAKTRISK